MSVQDTSLESYEDIRSKLGARQEAVRLALNFLGEATNTMIARKLSLPINCIVPRVFELRQKDLVEESYKDKCPLTGCRAIFWRIKWQE